MQRKGLLVKLCFKTRLEDRDLPGQAVPHPPGLNFKHFALFSARSLEQTKDLCPRVLWVAGGQRWSFKRWFFKLSYLALTCTESVPHS